MAVRSGMTGELLTWQQNRQEKSRKKKGCKNEEFNVKIILAFLG